MIAPKEILAVWNKFSDFQMETLSKAWFWDTTDDLKQRTVELMKEHRDKYGSSGNCFDLAIWLLHEFNIEGIKAYEIGDNLKTSDEHVAVIAIGENGYRYLCDLGDQWISPILIDKGSYQFSESFVGGFFPCAKVKVEVSNEKLKVSYLRPNDKQSQQTYSLKPLDEVELFDAAEHSQNLLRKPLVEKRVMLNDEVKFWEFCNWTSFSRSDEGLINEDTLDSNDQWAERINKMTGMDKKFVLKALEVYENVMNKK